MSGHCSHEEHRKVRNLYREEIANAKQEHWATFLEDMTYGEIWVANRYISSNGGNGGKTRILTLYLHPSVGVNAPPQEAASNSDKSAMLAGLMFPACSPDSMVPMDFRYEDQLPDPLEITEEQILWHLGGLSPYKAPGTDEIPTVVWKSMPISSHLT